LQFGPYKPPLVEFGEAVWCPFCGAGELSPAHDRAIQVEPGPAR
jgi:hypothetical protein